MPGERKPDFQKGDRVRLNEGQCINVKKVRYERGYYSDRPRKKVYTEEVGSSNCNFVVTTSPYRANKRWTMEVETVEHEERYEVPCHHFHLVGERNKKGSIAKKTLKELRVKLTKPAIATAVIGGVVLFTGLWVMGNYNSLVKSKADVDNSWAKVETQYQRRFDLIGNIVQSVKGAQIQEQKVFGQIADARKQYQNASTTSEKAEAAQAIETNVALIPRLQEAYPELKSNNQVTKLIDELKGTEDAIAGVRDGYNNTATNYNVNIKSFPKSAFANMFNFKEQKLFKAVDSAKEAPKVRFGN